MKQAPTTLIDTLLDSVHDWLMYDGHNWGHDDADDCDVCEGEEEADSDSQLTAARWVFEFIADEFTRYSDLHNPED